MSIGNHTMPTQLLADCSRSEGMMWCISKWAFDVTQGLFFTMMLLAFCITLFMSLSRIGTARAFGYASFVGMIGSVWLGIALLIPWWTVSAFVITGVIGIVVMIMQGK